MSGWKGGGLLFVLAIPLALYAAWHVKGVVRTDMVVSDPPPERGATKEQLAQSKDKATRWATEARKATTVTIQYSDKRLPDAPGEPSAAEVVTASVARSADLVALDLFLAGIEDPKPGGKLEGHYVTWREHSNKARELGRGITMLLNSPLKVDSANAAERVMEDLNSRIESYLKVPQFSSRQQAALWRITGRMAVIKELIVQADAQYPDAVKVSLPLRPGANAMETARKTFEAVQSQVKALDGDRKIAEDDKADVKPMMREINERIADAAKCSSRGELLKLFSQSDLFSNASGAVTWLREVSVLYKATTNDADKKIIRKKVEEFCEAFLPQTVRLDDEVMFKNKTVLRKNVVVEYVPAAGARVVSVDLSSDTDGLNELNVADRYPGKETEVRHLGAPGLPKDLEATPVSHAAVVYNRERKAVSAPGITGSKWTVNTVEELKKKCEAQADLVDKLDKLKLPRKKGDTAPDDEQKIRVRLTGLFEGLRAHPELIDMGP